MKSVLISIRPEWCHVIASGKKTVEVRKTKPKLKMPFKVYIYCTKDEPLYRSGEKFWCPNDDCGNGKVIDMAQLIEWREGVKCSMKKLDEVPTADVVKKSEVERWRRNLEAVLEERAEEKAKVAREIFEEIDNWFELYSEREYSFAEEETSKGHLPEAEAHDYALDIIKDLRQLCVAELKNKYTEG